MQGMGANATEVEAFLRGLRARQEEMKSRKWDGGMGGRVGEGGREGKEGDGEGKGAEQGRRSGTEEIKQGRKMRETDDD